ncbi:23S rRNA (pseudouridine(1915)-N(3))-methyltransferase RlmH [Croceibacter atlanticus]|jgi:23S rRNA (pseudouridine1915-N3)-methyltransferase|uniref:23S rRNA (pseudouridine(1915)-N(3))-methyltransferase RlmH n=1 Tax=Croceibacter atlanticus TaxID=313588 RepID=UPI000E93724F|nr:23S rRNA (pseudouridine(1915)-N(3))-methyltransferase RlmH [Croceibacter atlanticus]HAT69864.1 23S rRNA (pseudouridine(1915)-N(3))-methyltransferase RlmH [Flavobacteriaceae bacterium]|tara:strand:+ start:76063 stop:76536 length:474 start_codon:yes stop_codon:yes gene_type:complete
MNIQLYAIGKTDQKLIEELTDIYTKRLGHYINFDFTIIPDIKNTKNLSIEQQKNEEGKLIMKQLETSDFVILLDENGKEFSSVNFSAYLQKRMNTGLKRLVFIIGGPYGFSTEVYSRANSKLSLSKMTFSHQMIRVFFIEQLYRAFTILRNEPYHHQ